MNVEKSALEEIFACHLKAYHCPEPQREYEFHPTRKWRFDFAWPEEMIAVEVEGWGRHQKRDGFEADIEKYNTAVYCGWALYRFNGKMVRDGRAIDFMRTVLLA